MMHRQPEISDRHTNDDTRIRILCVDDHPLLRKGQQAVAKVLAGDNPGQVADEDHGTWYREHFAPSVTSGILKPADLAGYRTSQVYIRKSMHVPLNPEAVRDAMPAFFDLLREEKHPAVRVVLGHFFFVYIHPYMDGNGRIGRFLMNVDDGSGWIPVDHHSRHRPRKVHERFGKSLYKRGYRPFR
jgi:hypothetical protein